MSSNEKEKPFNYVFEKCNLPDDIKETFKNTIVEDIILHEKDNFLEIIIKDKQSIESNKIENMKLILEDEFPLLNEINEINEIKINFKLDKPLENKTVDNIIKKADFTQEQHDKAVNTNLSEFLSSKGYELMRKGRDFCLKEHDSLVLKNNTWFWHSRGFGGSSIQFLQTYENKSFVDSVIELANFSGFSFDKTNIPEVSTVKNKPEYDKFELPEKHERFTHA